MMNTEKQELTLENLETVAGGTPMSIPGGKRSGRKNSETALEIFNRFTSWADGLLEDIGLKEKARQQLDC